MRQFLRDEQATVAIEYSLLITFIGLVMAGGLHLIGMNLSDVFSSVEGGLTPVQLIENKQRSGV